MLLQVLVYTALRLLLWLFMHGIRMLIAYEEPTASPPNSRQTPTFRTH